jgi:hypothetical protein
MLNLNKHISFFNPSEVKAPVHVIGVGAMGSRIAEQLARLGVDNIHLYDFDVVEDVNIANQLYNLSDIGMSKVDAMVKHLNDINPNCVRKVHPKGYKEQPLQGYIFLCVDNISIRQQIVKNNFHNPNLKAIFDTRMRLTDAQSYAADWTIDREKNNLYSTMDFTEEEAKAATPVSACGTSLSVCPTVLTCVSLTVSNFMNFVKGDPIKNMILIDAFEYIVNVF